MEDAPDERSSLLSYYLEDVASTLQLPPPSFQ